MFQSVALNSEKPSHTSENNTATKEQCEAVFLGLRREDATYFLHGQERLGTLLEDLVALATQQCLLEFVVFVKKVSPVYNMEKYD